ncbi:hypothetical protein WR25_19868 [Diploscapter pachys]|uniref:Uncharacterized protein n=1 Tax=Diploscapter pachys TaxID=2018661 RepID=A0A2A2JWC4_9BILA|nr:hypothetical protein WR25_19868 [Diploscapter pachys]
MKRWPRAGFGSHFSASRKAFDPFVSQGQIVVRDRVTFADRVLHLLLKKLQASPVFVDDLAPSFYADGEVSATRNQATLRINAILHRVAPDFVEIVRDYPKMPADALDRAKPLVVTDCKRILAYLVNLFRADFDLRRLQFDNQMLELVGAMPTGGARKHEVYDTALLSDYLNRLVDGDVGVKQLLMLDQHVFEDGLQLGRSALDGVAEHAEVQRTRLISPYTDLGRNLVHMNGHDVEDLPLRLFDVRLRLTARSLGISTPLDHVQFRGNGWLTRCSDRGQCHLALARNRSFWVELFASDADSHVPVVDHVERENFCELLVSFCRFERPEIFADIVNLNDYPGVAIGCRHVLADCHVRKLGISHCDLERSIAFRGGETDLPSDMTAQREGLVPPATFLAMYHAAVALGSPSGTFPRAAQAAEQLARIFTREPVAIVVHDNAREPPNKVIVHQLHVY